MRVSVEPGESSVRVKKNGAEVGVARPGAEINEPLNAGDNMELEGFDEAEGETVVQNDPAAEPAAQEAGEQQEETQGQ